MQLYAPVELDQLQQDLYYLNQTVEWVNNFLAKPHRQLGRSGPVCPFLPKALHLDMIRFAVIRTQGMGAAQIEQIVRQYRDQFLELEPKTGELAFYKAFMLIFPDVSNEQAPELIDEVQRKLKPFFVEEGLMIGEFHQNNQTPGLHNPDFRPLQSPIPMLAIRFMAETDLPFLERLSDEPERRVRYLEAYLSRMASVLKDEGKLDHAQRSLELAKSQLDQFGSESPKVSKCPFARLAKVFG